MTDKAYIVANEQQEREVLETFEREGYLWSNGEKPTEWLPSDTGKIGKATFPYVLINRVDIRWSSLNEFNHDATVIYDGRKEEQMSEKYVVSQEFMNELEEWKKQGNTDVYFVGSYDLSMLPDDVKRWWNYPEINNFECNNRLIAIIRWVNGQDVFEVDKPKKWVVRSKWTDIDNDHRYVRLLNKVDEINDVVYYMSSATLFDTKEEAESWANAHQEVVQVEVDE